MKPGKSIDSNPNTSSAGVSRNRAASAGDTASLARQRGVVPAARSYSLFRVRLPLLVLTLLASAQAWPAIGLAAPGPTPGAAVGTAVVPSQPSAMLVLIVGLMGLGALVNTLLSIWSKLKPRPPYHQQFAPLGHVHPEYAAAHETQEMRDTCASTRLQLSIDRARDLDSVRTRIDTGMASIRNDLEGLNKSAEARASKLHQRIDPMAQGIVANQRQLETHLADHRANLENRHAN